MAKYWVFRIAAIVVPRLPLWLTRPLAIGLGALIWALAAGTRARAKRNLRHIPALAADPAALRRATRGVFQHMALNYLDFLRGKSISDAELLRGWTIENQEAFDAAVARGNGVIILTGHFGNFELGASRLGVLGYKVVTPAEHMRPEEVFQLFCRLRQHHNMRLVPTDARDALRELYESLRRGEVVVFAVDRHVAGSTAEVPFFEAPAHLPAGPAAMALRSRTPVFGVFSWRESHGRSRGVFIPLELNGTATADEVATPAKSTNGDNGSATRNRNGEEVLHAMRIFVAQMEQIIAAHPEQWVSALARVWDKA